MLNNMTIRMDDEKLKKVDEWVAQSGAKSRNQFVLQALDFYISHLASKDATALLAPAITTAIDARLKRFEKNIAENLFRVAVEQDMVVGLDRSLNRVERERPQLRRYIDQQEAESNAIKDSISILKAEIDGVYSQIDDIARIRDLNDRRAKVFGRISYWLENVQITDSLTEQRTRVREIEERIAEIDAILSNDSIKDRVSSALSIIQNDMTAWAGDLEMEYVGSPYRIDLGKVTVVVDHQRPVPLREMGSASNWLGAHLITMFGLHKFFINNRRPGDRFVKEKFIPSRFFLKG